MLTLKVISTSVASDLGYRALADLAFCGAKLKYVVIGGHMVQLLIQAYPTPLAIQRATRDADAGLEQAEVAGQGLQEALLKLGYQPTNTNRYEMGNGFAKRQIDILVDVGKPGKPAVIAGKQFDHAPGLMLALAEEPLDVAVEVRLKNGEYLSFEVPVPRVETALILKALAWRSRKADKDTADILALLEIVQLHKKSLNGWQLQDSKAATLGTRKDAAVVLHQMATSNDRRPLSLGEGRPGGPRLSALIRAHVLDSTVK